MSDAAPADYLTVGEVAKALRLSGMTVYRMIERGDLSAVRVGRSFRVPRPAFEAVQRGPGADVPLVELTPIYRPEHVLMAHQYAGWHEYLPHEPGYRVGRKYVSCRCGWRQDVMGVDDPGRRELHPGHVVEELRSNGGLG